MKLKLSNKRLSRLYCCVLLVGLAVSGQDAAALPPVPIIDPVRIAALEDVLEQMGELKTMVDNVLGQYLNAATMLPRALLTPRAQRSYNRAWFDSQQLGYHHDTIEGQLRQVFPTGAAVQRATPEQRQQMVTVWERELDQAALIASRTQNSTAVLQESATAAQRVVQASDSAGAQGSRLAQMQALVQALAGVNRDLITLSTTLAANNRVQSVQTAVGTEKQRLQQQSHADRMRGYAQPSGRIEAVRATRGGVR